MHDEKHDEILEAMARACEKQLYSLDAIRRACVTEVTDADFRELEQRGLIIYSGSQVTFTNQGKSIAEGIMRRHRLAEVLLSSILKLKNSELEEVACRAEHHLLPEVEEAICTLLGHPEFCPDGNPIPEADVARMTYDWREGW